MADQPPVFSSRSLIHFHSVDRSICDTSQRAASTFFIPLPRQEHEGVDALSHSWDFPGVLYVFAPTLLLTAVLGRTSRPVLLLAHACPRQPWYSSLVELSVAHAVRLPLDLFPLTQGNFTHPSSTMYNLHVWTLLRTSIKDRDSLTTLPTSWLIRYGF